jgi:hypothetical protein
VVVTPITGAIAMHIRHATIKLQLPVECHKCGAVETSETITVEIKDCDRDGIDRELNRVRVGTHFPVGWASYYGNASRDIYKCPSCK